MTKAQRKLHRGPSKGNLYLPRTVQKEGTCTLKLCPVVDTLNHCTQLRMRLQVRQLRLPTRMRPSLRWRTRHPLTTALTLPPHHQHPRPQVRKAYCGRQHKVQRLGLVDTSGRGEVGLSLPYVWSILPILLPQLQSVLCASASAGQISYCNLAGPPVALSEPGHQMQHVERSADTQCSPGAHQPQPGRCQQPLLRVPSSHR